MDLCARWISSAVLTRDSFELFSNFLGTAQKRFILGPWSNYFNIKLIIYICTITLWLFIGVMECFISGVSHQVQVDFIYRSACWVKPCSCLALTCVRGDQVTSRQLRCLAVHTWHYELFRDHVVSAGGRMFITSACLLHQSSGFPLHLFLGRNAERIVSCILLRSVSKGSILRSAKEKSKVLWMNERRDDERRCKKHLLSSLLLLDRLYPLADGDFSAISKQSLD